MWVYCSIKNFGRPVRQFVYQPGWSGTYPQKYLKGCHGFIHTDAYKGYEKVSGITRCICWTHLRRYLIEAFPKEVDSPEATIPAQAVRYINQLFEIEKKLEVLSPAGRKEQRLVQEKHVLDAFLSGVKEASSKVLASSRLGKAFQYANNQKE